MSNLPLVSIVTPSYNQAAFLEETILSVLNQDYPNLEYIIIDGGSTDGSQDIIRNYENKLAFWVSEKDRGQTHAIIKGFEKANGIFCNWLCSDDVLEPSMVSISVQFLLDNPDVGMTFGDQIRIDRKGNIYSLRRFPSFRPRFIKWGFSIPQETVLFRREIFEKVGGLDESLHMVMDFDLWCRISKESAILHIPAILGRFRVHDTNKSSIFTDQLQEEGFTDGLPAEYAKIYQKHFGRNPSLKTHRHINMLIQLMAFAERRTGKFRKDMAAAEQIRLR